MTPKDTTALLKRYQTARNERLDLDEQSKKLKVEEDSILDMLTAAGVESGKYGPYKLTVKTKATPRCTDWEGLWAYIKDTNSFELLHKRLTEVAIMERLDAGEHLPGIVTDEKVTYKIVAA
jgi:hypothetical protein